MPASASYAVLSIAVGSVIALLIIGPIVYFRLKKLKNTHPGSGQHTKELHAEKVKSDIILNSIADGVIVIDYRNNIQLLNPAGSKLTGWPIQEAVGLDYHAVLTLVNEKGETYIDQDNPFWQVFQQKTTVRDTAGFLKTRNDKRIPVSLQVTPIMAQDGQQIIAAVGVFRDVAQERNEEARRAEFISTASHEMRTPVAAIEGYLALAMNDKVAHIDDKARGFLEKAHYSTQHLGQLFQDLLTSAKAEDGRLSSHPTVVEMGQFIERLTEDLRFGAEKKGLQVEFILGGNDGVIDATTPNHKSVQPLYYVYADPDRVREVITNIFDNAVKYTDKGKVTMGLTGDQSVVQVRISDTGPGIPAEDIPHLFQKFYRVDNSATRTIGGTGLGLFICRKIIELYQGKIWVESHVNEGSTFFINLPRLSTEKAAQVQALEATRVAPLEQSAVPVSAGTVKG